MKSFNTQITINANADTIWRLLIDTANWPQWNTTVDKVEGSIDEGRITVHAKISPGRAFPVKVAELDAPHRMVWRAGMPLGLFKGERIFTLTDVDATTTQFAMSETFTGLLAPLIGKSIPDLQPTFEEFAQCLKQRAEES